MNGWSKRLLHEEGSQIKSTPLVLTPENAQKTHKGAKTQARRILVPQPDASVTWYGQHYWYGNLSHAPAKDLVLWWPMKGDSTCIDKWISAGKAIRCPYGSVGDQLWVRESCYIWDRGVGNQSDREVVYLDDPDLETILFDRAEIAAVKRRGHFPVHIGNWYKRTAMFMPKWACRTWLEVTEVHVEQLGNITDADAKAEGMRGIREFIEFWKSIHRTWDPALWVWVLWFKKIEHEELQNLAS